MKKYLIIGNGVAGTTAAEEIRKHDTAGDITVLTDEDVPFYYRVRLPDYISGKVDEQSLIAKDADWYATRKINLITNAPVAAIDHQKKTAVTGKGGNSRNFPYDALLIATGSHSFLPPIPGVDQRGVLALRSMADARQIIACSEGNPKTVLIGGGLLGLEAGNALLKHGNPITVVEFLPRLLPRQLDPRGALRLQKIMEKMGFSFCIGAASEEITGGASVTGLRLKDGRNLEAGLVIISAGVRPNLELAKSLDLKCGKGIIVDSTMQTSQAGVFAAGDVAEHDGVLYGIWPAALQQGRTAGANMAGVKSAYTGTVMATKLKVVGIDLASAGEIDADETRTSLVEENEARYQKIVLNEDRVVIGCVLLGDTKKFNALTSAISDKTKIDDLKMS